MRRLNQEHAALSEDLPGKSIDVGTAVESIRTFAASWAKAKPATGATMIQSVYEESSFAERSESASASRLRRTPMVSRLVDDPRFWRMQPTRASKASPEGVELASTPPGDPS